MYWECYEMSKQHTISLKSKTRKFNGIEKINKTIWSCAYGFQLTSLIESYNSIVLTF